MCDKCWRCYTMLAWHWPGKMNMLYKLHRYYFGHVICPGRAGVATRTIDTICQLEFSTTISELQSFLGLCNLFRSFAPNCHRLASLLNMKLFKGTPQTFDGIRSDKIIALKMLKAKLKEHTVLAFPNLPGDYTIDTHACKKQINCVYSRRNLREQTDEMEISPVC